MGSLRTRVTCALNASVFPGSVPALVMRMGGSEVVKCHMERKLLNFLTYLSPSHIGALFQHRRASEGQ